MALCEGFPQPERSWIRSLILVNKMALKGDMDVCATACSHIIRHPGQITTSVGYPFLDPFLDLHTIALALGL